VTARWFGNERRSWRRWTGRGLVFGLLLLRPSPAAAEATADARLRASLVWILGDDDVLHGPSDTSPASPSAGIGDRSGYSSLFDGLASRYTGRENRGEARLTGEAPGVVPSLTTRAGLALGFDVNGLGDRPSPLLVEDLGSFVEGALRLGPGRPGRDDALVVRLLPLNGDRQRVGALEKLAWGGAIGPDWESPYASASGPVRAARLDLLAGIVEAHGGLKTATFLEAQPTGPAVDETSYGWFGGVRSRWAAPVGVTLGFGHFEHGRLPGPAGAPRATTTGVSLGLTWRCGLDRALSPVAFSSDGSPFEAPAGSLQEHGVAVAVEGVHLVERLWSLDTPGTSVLAPARGAAVLVQVRAGLLDLRTSFLVRDALFVMRNAFGVFPGEALPRDLSERPELTAALSAGIVGPTFRPVLSVGVLVPAAVSTTGVDRFGQPVGTTLVVRGPSDVGALPPGRAPVPVFEARPSTELSLSRLLSIVGWAHYVRDFNHTRLVPAAGGALGRGFQNPDRLGLGLAARAVW